MPAAAQGIPEVPGPLELWHQPPVTPVAEQIDGLHLLLVVIMVGICVLVIGLLGFVAIRFRASRHRTPSRRSHNTALEIVWTLTPALLLVLIAIPSFRALYFLDRTEDAALTVKATGHQWYWSYEYPDQGNLTFDSTLVPAEDLAPDQPRLLQTDNAMVIPAGVKVRVLSTATDVLHSWSVPAFGIKVDSVPGRVNEVWLQVDREGTYYGQCSELCGTNHFAMPIMVRVVSPAEFESWVAEARAKFAAADPPPYEKHVSLGESSGW